MSFFCRLPLKTLLPLLMLAFMVTSAWSADKGRVTGQVKDSLNNIFLMGVLVSAEDGQTKTVTDRNGNFSLSLPVGEQEITFSYLGYKSVTQAVVVADGATAMLDVDFSQTSMQMDQMVVQGQAVGQAKALNQQKNAPNLKNIVASDAIGRFPDQNAAEALDRIPGVSIERDQGEGRFVMVRGIDPHLNSASVDGVALSSADDGTRAVLLDTLPMNVMGALEVTKALTADMPADAIGGQINIISPSAFDRSEQTLHGSVGSNYSDLTEKFAPNAHLTFGNVFGDKQQFGALVSISYDERDFGSDNVEADEWFPDGSGFFTPDDAFEFREYDLNRERVGITSNFEYKPDDNNRYHLRALYGSFTDHEYRHATKISSDDWSAASQDNGTVTGTETEVAMKDREETQMNWTLSLGGENKIDDWTIDYNIAYSYAEQDTPSDTEVIYINEDLEYSYTGATSDTPSLIETTGDQSVLSGYEFDGGDTGGQIVEEDAWIFSTNVKKELDTSFQSFLKTGFHIALRSKSSDKELYEYDAIPANLDTLEGLTYDGRSTYSGDIPLIAKSTSSPFRAISLADMDYNIEDSKAEDYETDENVYAGYMMGEAKFGRLSLIPGIRVEHTELKATGTTFNEDTEEVGSQKAKNSYTNILPSLHGKYNFTDNLVFYAAWTNTLSRPEWDHTRYGRFTDDDGNVELGNPDLDPYQSMNWDATLSYYLPDSIGVASIGFFYKDIKDFIYSQTTDLGTYELTTWRNGDSGNIYGIELVYQQQLVFLPVDGFSFEGNLTLSESEADFLAAEAGDASRTLDFLRHSDTVASVALSYEKYDFFVRLSGSYRSSYLDDVGDEPLTDRYVDDHFQVDLSSSYTIMDKYTVFANVINLTNEPFKAYWGESGRLSQFEEYGWSANAGLKFNF